MKTKLLSTVLTLCVGLFTVLPTKATTILISDFDNTGWDLYSGTGWTTGATLGADFLSLESPAVATGNASFNRFINPIPDLTGSTEFNLDLRLGSGNAINEMVFFVSDFETIFEWNFTAVGAGLNTSNFTTLVFDLASPDMVTGSGILDLDDIGQIGYGGGSIAESGLDVRIQFDNLIATVPEPTSAGLLAAAGLLLLRRRTSDGRIKS